ncbi:MAG: signal recognition particle-docking protein FtsY, partial [Bacteroidetes bacterium]|nr:signal recognition particle-docking protein FtsY [Bacteroidota bacterium]
TAGRMHTKSNLMEELKKVHRVLNRLDPAAPHQVILTLDATTGQNGLAQAKSFKEAVACTGIFLAKLDGTARGGIALAIKQELQVPILFIGTGEGLSDLAPFDSRQFVDSLLAPIS